MAVTTEKTAFGGWPNCVRIANDTAELIVTTDIGPRIVRYALLGGQNFMCEVKAQQGKTGGDEWRIYGGHRLWHSPEDMPRSYQPDNMPVKWEQIENGIHVIQDTESYTGIRKELEITLDPISSKVTVLHRLTNEGAWEAELAAWALTVLTTGGVEIVPHTQRDTGMLPNRVLALWPYTHMNDSRVTWGDRYITIKQDANATCPFKIGTSNENGWMAYMLNNQMFLKRYEHFIDGIYPDYNTSFQTYTCDFMLEMETLSPLALLNKGECIEHAETWQIIDNVPLPKTEEQIDSMVDKYIK